MYDVRAIRFIKSTVDINSNYAPTYICLGHFDGIEVDRLGGGLTSQPFQAIQNDRVSGREGEFDISENRVYSLYILRQVLETENERQALEDFWEKDDDLFTIVTRIHCEASRSEPFQTISSLLRQFCLVESQKPQLVSPCQSVNQGGEVLTLEGAVAGPYSKTEPVRCVFYDSLELGDTVAIMKGRSLAAILEIVRYLSLVPQVRDTYTYCGILLKLLTGKTEAASALNAQAQLYGVTSRFSIRDSRQAEQFFCQFKQELRGKANLRDSEFYVTGTADHLISWGKCSERLLLDIVRYLVQHKEAIDVCFNGVITRVGLAAYSLDGDGDLSTEAGEETIYSRFTPTLNIPCWLSEIQRSSNPPGWVRIVSKLLGILSTMENNYVMDDLAKLLLPGVQAFLERLDDLKKENQLIGGHRYDADIHSFLDAWAALNNDVTQLESQLTQHPELIPVRYYIPALLLQFELRFLEYCSTALSDSGKRSFHPMLVTTNGFNMYTECPLDPKDSSYVGKCPLLVYIPIHDLYRPWEIVVRATHEMAHYCEDEARFRNERYEILAECLAQYILDMWNRDIVQDLHISDESSQNEQKTEEKATPLEILKKVILDCAERNFPHNKDAEGGYHLKPSKQAFYYAIYDVESQTQYMENYLLQLSDKNFYENRILYQQITGSNKWMGLRQNQLQEARSRLDILCYLCAECYADIAMVLLLKLGFDEYYQSVYQDEYERLRQSYDIDRRPISRGIVRHVERMALVMASVGGMQEKDFWTLREIRSSPNCGSSWVNMAIKVLEWSKNSALERNVRVFCNRPSEITPEMLDADTFNLMQTYLIKCAHALNKKLNENPDSFEKRNIAIKTVRENILYVSDRGFDWEKIQSFLI